MLVSAIPAIIDFGRLGVLGATLVLLATGLLALSYRLPGRKS
jgi:hypothetical protein